MRKILAVALLICAGPALAAEVVSAFVWEAPAGYGQQMYENAMRAKAMHEEMGANVFVGVDQMQNMHYGLRFKNAAARGKFNDRLLASAEWQAFMNGAARQVGAAELQGAGNMSVALEADGDPGRAMMVFGYRPNPGAMQETLANSARAKEMQSKMGADVEVNITEDGHVLYVMSFDSWEAQGKFEDALQDDEDWNEFWNSITANPSAQLVNVLRITRVASTDSD